MNSRDNEAMEHPARGQIHSNLKHLERIFHLLSPMAASGRYCNGLEQHTNTICERFERKNRVRGLAIDRHENRKAPKLNLTIGAGVDRKEQGCNLSELHG